MTVRSQNRPAAIRVVIPFVFRHWLNQPLRTATVAGGLLGATAADLFMPVFSGHLVDALTRGADDPTARHAAFVAFGAIVALGLTSMILRLIGLQAIVPFTLKIMSDVARGRVRRTRGQRVDQLAGKDRHEQVGRGRAEEARNHGGGAQRLLQPMAEGERKHDPDRGRSLGLFSGHGTFRPRIRCAGRLHLGRRADAIRPRESLKTIGNVLGSLGDRGSVPIRAAGS